MNMNNLPLINKQQQPQVFPKPECAVLLYFSAHWCGPCRQFTPLLRAFYDMVKRTTSKLEIIFVSSDRSERDMLDYYRSSHGDWLAVPFFVPQRVSLGSQFGVQGIPSLHLLNWGSMNAVKLDLRGLIQQYAMQGVSPSRLCEVVQEWRDRSGATLFEAVPLSLSKLSNFVEAQEVINILTRLVHNICVHPTEPKYKQLKDSNATIRKTVLDMPCGDAPLLAVGFRKDTVSGTYNFLPSFVDPYTTLEILQKWESNGLASKVIFKTIPSQSVPKIVGSESTVLSSVSILFRDNPPTVIDEFAYESFEILQTLIESVTDVPAERQLLFSDPIKATGAISRGTCGDAKNSVQALLFSSFNAIGNNKRQTGTPTVVTILVKSLEPDACDPSLTDELAHALAAQLRVQLTTVLNSVPLALAVHCKLLVNVAMNVQLFETPSYLDKAVEVVPVMRIHNLVMEKTWKEDEGSKMSSDEPSYDFLFVSALLHWFCTEFFESPKCTACNSGNAKILSETSAPTEQELKGMPTCVEMYLCAGCGSTIRFPRYQHPLVLLHSRSGRAMESINCFFQMARGLGVPARKVVLIDFANTETVSPDTACLLQVWVESQWVRVDFANGGKLVRVSALRSESSVGSVLKIINQSTRAIGVSFKAVSDETAAMSGTDSEHFHEHVHEQFHQFLITLGSVLGSRWDVTPKS